MSDHAVESRSQVKPTDHVVPTIRTPPGHRRRCARNDQGQPAGLHDELRCGDVAPTMPKLADDHIGYGRAPTYLTGWPRQQDGVVVEQTRERPCVIEQAGVLEQCFQLLRAGGAGGHVGTRKLGRVARPTAWCDRSRPRSRTGRPGPAASPDHTRPPARPSDGTAPRARLVRLSTARAAVHLRRSRMCASARVA